VAERTTSTACPNLSSACPAFNMFSKAEMLQTQNRPLQMRSPCFRHNLRVSSKRHSAVAIVRR